MGRLIERESPSEYFKQLLDEAVKRRQVDVSPEACYYLVLLLAGFAGEHRTGHRTGLQGQPLGLRLIRAMHAAGAEQRAILREVGDLSLFLAGFFSDSFKRSLADVDYYVALGGFAYRSLSRKEARAAQAMFVELSDRFVTFVDLLADVSERTGSGSSTDLLRTYEKWLRTGSRREHERLVREGIVPNASIGSRFLQ